MFLITSLLGLTWRARVEVASTAHVIVRPFRVDGVCRDPALSLVLLCVDGVFLVDGASGPEHLRI